MLCVCVFCFFALVWVGFECQWLHHSPSAGGHNNSVMKEKEKEKLGIIPRILQPYFFFSCTNIKLVFFSNYLDILFMQAHVLC